MGDRELDLSPIEGSLWLHDLLRRCSEQGWCTKRGCTTCGCPEMRALITGRHHPFADRDFLGKITDERARAIVKGLRLCNPVREKYTSGIGAYRNYENAVMWVLWVMWLRFGDKTHEQFFPELEGSWAGDVLDRMKEHYARVQENRRRHHARQGLKKKDWPE